MTQGGQKDGGLLGELGKLDEAFSQTPSQKTSLPPLPDGKYIARIVYVRLGRAGEGGPPAFKWKFTITEGDYSGRHVWHRQIVSEENLKFIRRDFDAVELQVEKLSEAAELLPQLTNVAVEIALKTRNEFQNVYINRRIRGDAEHEGAGEAGAGQSDEETIDFMV